jgi:hypothetical protein
MAGAVAAAAAIADRVAGARLAAVAFSGKLDVSSHTVTTVVFALFHRFLLPDRLGPVGLSQST